MSKHVIVIYSKHIIFISVDCLVFQSFCWAFGGLIFVAGYGWAALPFLLMMLIGSCFCGCFWLSLLVTDLCVCYFEFICIDFYCMLFNMCWTTLNCFPTGREKAGDKHSNIIITRKLTVLPIFPPRGLFLSIAICQLGYDVFFFKHLLDNTAKLLMHLIGFHTN